MERSTTNTPQPTSWFWVRGRICVACDIRCGHFVWLGLSEGPGLRVAVLCLSRICSLRCVTDQATKCPIQFSPAVPVKWLILSLILSKVRHLCHLVLDHPWYCSMRWFYLPQTFLHQTMGLTFLLSIIHQHGREEEIGICKAHRHSHRNCLFGKNSCFHLPQSPLPQHCLALCFYTY